MVLTRPARHQPWGVAQAQAPKLQLLQLRKRMAAAVLMLATQLLGLAVMLGLAEPSVFGALASR